MQTRAGKLIVYIDSIRDKVIQPPCWTKKILVDDRAADYVNIWKPISPEPKDLEIQL